MPSARDIAFIGCRLLALYVLYGTLLMVMFNVSDFLQMIAAQEVDWRGNPYFMRTLALLIANLGVFLALWFASDWVAGKVAAGTTRAKEAATTAWSRRDALSVGVTLLGLWVLVHHLPILLSYMPLILHGDAVEVTRNGHVSIDTRSIFSALLTTVLGVFFVLGSRGITEYIARLRRW